MSHPPGLRHSGRGGVADVGAGDADDDRHAAAVRCEDVVLQLVGALRASKGVIRLCTALWPRVGVGWTDHGGVLLVVPDVIDLVGDAVRHHGVLDPDARADREALRLELGAERLDGLQQQGGGGWGRGVGARGGGSLRGCWRRTAKGTYSRLPPSTVLLEYAMAPGCRERCVDW